MKWLGYREVAIKRIVLPGDIGARQKQAHVIELADSFEATGGEPGNCPWVEDGTMKLVAGRDRTAAALLRKAKRLWVRVGEFTPDELEEAEIVENLRRRNDDKAAQLARLVVLREQKETTPAETADLGGGISGQVTNNSAGRGRPTTARTRAIRDVARLAGTTPEAVRNAVRRTTAKRTAQQVPSGVEDGQVQSEGENRARGAIASGSAQADADAAPGGSPPPIRTFGVTIADDFAAKMQAQQAAIDAVDKLLKQAQAACKALESSEHPAAQNIRAELHRIADHVRSQRPAALCPEGKGLCDTGCPLCRGGNWVGEAALAHLPPELLIEGEGALVRVQGGGLGLLSDVVAGRVKIAGSLRPSANRAHTAPRRKLLITDDDGNPLVDESRDAPEVQAFSDPPGPHDDDFYEPAV